MSAILSLKLQNNSKYSRVFNFVRTSESCFSVLSLTIFKNLTLHLFWWNLDKDLTSYGAITDFFQLIFHFFYQNQDFKRYFFTFFVFRELFLHSDSHQNKWPSFSHLLFATGKKITCCAASTKFSKKKICLPFYAPGQDFSLLNRCLLS